MPAQAMGCAFTKLPAFESIPEAASAACFVISLFAAFSTRPVILFGRCLETIPFVTSKPVSALILLIPAAVTANLPAVFALFTNLSLVSFATSFTDAPSLRLVPVVAHGFTAGLVNLIGTAENAIVFFSFSLFFINSL